MWFLDISWEFQSLKSYTFFFQDAVRAKLIAQKAKGMPRITISLSKLVDAAATEAVANLSLELYKSFKNVQNLLINGGALVLDL